MIENPRKSSHHQTEMRESSHLLSSSVISLSTVLQQIQLASHRVLKLHKQWLDKQTKRLQSVFIFYQIKALVILFNISTKQSRVIFFQTNSYLRYYVSEFSSFRG